MKLFFTNNGHREWRLKRAQGMSVWLPFTYEMRVEHGGRGHRVVWGRMVEPWSAK